MYGQIHCVIRELVQEKFGLDSWLEILRKSGLDGLNDFLVFTRYDDSLTLRLVTSVAQHVGLPTDAVLKVFGSYFFSYCLRHGYDKMLKTLGGDIVSFLQNLDSLHALLALSYTGIRAPSFRCEEAADGSLLLHYYSTRPGLHPIVIGLVESVGRDLFHQTVTLSVLEQGQEEVSPGTCLHHTAFGVHLHDNALSLEAGSPSRPPPVVAARLGAGSQGDASVNVCRSSPEGRSQGARGPESLLLNPQDLCTALPYHVVFDRTLRVLQCGVMVRHFSATPIPAGMPLSQLCSVVHPVMHLTIDNIFKFINAVFLLALHRKAHHRPFLLKGQMAWMASSRHMIFIGSPRLTSLDELMEMNVYLADIPLYDVTRELVLLNQQRIAEIDVAKQLDETTAELKRTSRALQEEKQKTESLLHQMLPEKIATQLTSGKSVEAEKFDSVTILFSDIVTFTNIAAACSPLHIVHMLNDLYHRFDSYTTTHGVYKVETIGDAYMVVGGAPEPQTDHPQRVARLALDMVLQAALVTSPASGLPLQIRVGVHTGPVVAGVVGQKMPRYCLFGDTVNTASRMESHGVPARIHISSATYCRLFQHGYSFKTRGQIEVKGKGHMTTYFLVGSPSLDVKEPLDEFSPLPVERFRPFVSGEQQEVQNGHHGGPSAEAGVTGGDNSSNHNASFTTTINNNKKETGKPAQSKSGKKHYTAFNLENVVPRATGFASSKANGMSDEFSACIPLSTDKCAARDAEDRSAVCLPQLQSRAISKTQQQRRVGDTDSSRPTSRLCAVL